MRLAPLRSRADREIKHPGASQAHCRLVYTFEPDGCTQKVAVLQAPQPASRRRRWFDRPTRVLRFLFLL